MTKPTVSQDMEDTFIYASWGYNQTNIDMAKIVEVSDTGKTVVAQRVKKERVSSDGRNEQVKPTDETYGDKFRLHVREFNSGKTYFKGSYPYSGGSMDEGKRCGTFFIHDKQTVGETAPLAGH